MSRERERAGALKVTYRRLVHEAGGKERVMAVFCPRRDGPIDVRECRSCEHCQGLCVDPSDRHTFLRCTYQSEGSAPADPPSRSGSPTRDTPLSAVMTAPARTVTADSSLAALTGLFLEAGISAAPVVDERGRAIGIVSKSDLLRAYSEAERESLATEAEQLGQRPLGAAAPDGTPPARAGEARVFEVMTRLVFALGADASLSRAAALMSYEGVHRIVVTAADGTALGVVSALDILRFMARCDGYVVPDLTRIQSDRAPEPER
jgi:CBS domain-containing protein